MTSKTIEEIIEDGKRKTALQIQKLTLVFDNMFKGGVKYFDRFNLFEVQRPNLTLLDFERTVDIGFDPEGEKKVVFWICQSSQTHNQFFKITFSPNYFAGENLDRYVNGNLASKIARLLRGEGEKDNSDERFKNLYLFRAEAIDLGISKFSWEITNKNQTPYWRLVFRKNIDKIGEVKVTFSANFFLGDEKIQKIVMKI